MTDADADAPARGRRSGRGGGRAARRAARSESSVDTVPYLERTLEPVSMLDEAGLARIEENAETILSEIGIAFQETPEALELWRAGDGEAALALLDHRPGLRSRVLRAAMRARLRLADEDARDEAARHARAALMEARRGLRPLDLVVTIAPLIGLLGTVLGMIAAFQALQETGNRADPAALAGGIWEALLTTAAGMGVAIPASAALAWFDGLTDGLAHDLEDLATRLFTLPLPQPQPQAA